MRIGIIAEFNPLHSGHKYLISKAKNLIKNHDSGEIICVMSEFFTQRGELAIINGYVRAKEAISAGCDLVLALPYRASVAYSDDFAKQSVDILVKCNITHLIFGTEQTINEFENFYKKEQDENLKQKINELTKAGYSYPKTMSILFNIENNNPNFILAYSYFKAIKKLAPHIKLLPIKREGQLLSDNKLENAKFLSATTIRNNPTDSLIENYVSSNIFKELRTKENFNEELIFPFIKYKILSSTPERLKNIYDISEGLENRIYSAALKANNYEELVNQIATKRYSKKKIQRVLLHIFTNSSKKDMLKPINDIRALAVKKEKTFLIKEINNNSKEIFIHQKLKKNNAHLFEHDIRVARLYQNISNEQDIFKKQLLLL